ncbi:MAG: hypothetical protein Kow0098_19290 [Ignavibacteriaceae bacterium]
MTEKKEDNFYFNNGLENIFPSSFNLYHGSSIEYSSFELNRKTNWITNVRIPEKTGTDESFNYIIQNNRKNIFIHGCTSPNARFLMEKGFNSVCIGREAILDLNFNHFSKKSLKELVNRGRKKGFPIELENSAKSRKELCKFKTEYVHAEKPQLKNLFNDKFEKQIRLFVLQDFEGRWLGCISTSLRNKNFVQTEMLLRSKNSPPGVIESLIYYIFNLLRNEGYSYWSLGAVPFIHSGDRKSGWEQIVSKTGRLLKFAYNYKGLYNFKKKFNPFWSDYFICSGSTITIRILYRLFRDTNLLKLTIHKLFRILIKISPNCFF